MIANNVYMHDNCIDVCVDLLSFKYDTDGNMVARVRWINLGYEGKPWYIDTEPQSILIKRMDILKWKFIGDDINVTRTKPGVPK